MLKRAMLSGWECVCDLCAHSWQSIALDPPAACPMCKSRAWDGVKRLGRPIVPNKIRDTSKLGLPKPKRVRSLQ